MTDTMLGQLLEKSIEFSCFNRLINICVRKSCIDDVIKQFGNLLESSNYIFTDVTNIQKVSFPNIKQKLLEVDLVIIIIDDVGLLTYSDILEYLKNRTNRTVGTILITEHMPLNKIESSEDIYNNAILVDV